MPPGGTSLLAAQHALQTYRVSLQACRTLLGAVLASAPRAFSTTRRRSDWLGPAQRPSHKTHKGRAHVPTGGSLRGTTVVWGTWGLRLASPGGRVSATQLRIADAAIARSLRAAGALGAYTVFRRVNASTAVYTKGSDQRMGKGKGGFDYWAARVARGRVVFEVSGKVHERVVRDALRIAGNKLPGNWEFVRRGDPPVMGNTVMREGITREKLFAPKRETPLHPLHKLPDGRRAGEVAVGSRGIETERVGME